MSFFTTPQTKLRLAVLATLGIPLTGCINTESIDPVETSQVVATYITDAPLDEYQSVIVTINKISAENKVTGAIVDLFDSSATEGKLVNLSELSSVSEYLDTTTLVEGEYEIYVTLANDVSLVDTSNTQITGRFNTTGDDKVIKVANDLVVDATDVDMSIDFDLARWEIDDTTKIITPIIERKDSERNLDIRIGKKGVITEIIKNTDGDVIAFNFKGRYQRSPMTVLLSAETVYKNDSDVQGSSLADASELAVDQVVSLEGKVTITAGGRVLTASTITLKDSDDIEKEKEDPNSRAKVEGKILEVAGDNSYMYLSVVESSMSITPYPVVGSYKDQSVVKLVGLGTANFEETSMANMFAGLELEVKGSYNATTGDFTAKKIELEGNYDNNQAALPYLKVKAQIVSDCAPATSTPSGTPCPVKVIKSYSDTVADKATATIDVDFTKTEVKRGSRVDACFKAETPLYITGKYDSATGTGGTLYAKKTEIIYGCRQSSNDDETDGSRIVAHAYVESVSPACMDAQATPQPQACTLSVKLFSLRGLAMPSDKKIDVTVPTTNIELDDVARAGLVAGEIFEIKGSLDSNDKFVARYIELEDD